MNEPRETNLAILSGYVRNKVSAVSKAGKPYCTFGLDQGNNKVHSCTYFGDAKLNHGDQVFVVGALDSSSFIAKNGKEYVNTKVIARSLHITGSMSDTIRDVVSDMVKGMTEEDVPF